MTFLTKPESVTERAQRRKLAAKILSNPCAVCMNREPELVFGHAVCSGTIGRTWWTCRDGKTKPTFELDHATIGESKT